MKPLGSYSLSRLCSIVDFCNMFQILEVAETKTYHDDSVGKHFVLYSYQFLQDHIAMLISSLPEYSKEYTRRKEDGEYGMQHILRVQATDEVVVEIDAIRKKMLSDVDVRALLKDERSKEKMEHIEIMSDKMVKWFEESGKSPVEYLKSYDFGGYEDEEYVREKIELFRKKSKAIFPRYYTVRKKDMNDINCHWKFNCKKG